MHASIPHHPPSSMHPSIHTIQATWQVVVCAWYLAFFSGELCIFPFVNLYMRQQGLSEQQIGIIGALRPWLGVPASFAWSALADYYQVHKQLIVLLTICYVAVRCLLPTVSSFAGIRVIIVSVELLGSPVTIMV